jgi:hypothetical protein
LPRLASLDSLLLLRNSRPIKTECDVTAAHDHCSARSQVVVREQFSALTESPRLSSRLGVAMSAAERQALRAP